MYNSSIVIKQDTVKRKKKKLKKKAKRSRRQKEKKQTQKKPLVKVKWSRKINKIEEGRIIKKQKFKGNIKRKLENPKTQ